MFLGSKEKREGREEAKELGGSVFCRLFFVENGVAVDAIGLYGGSGGCHRHSAHDSFTEAAQATLRLFDFTHSTACTLRCALRRLSDSRFFFPRLLAVLLLF